MDTMERADESKRLASLLSVSRAVRFAQNCCRRAELPPTRYTHLSAVSELAGLYAHRYYKDGDYVHMVHTRRALEAAGALHEVLQQSCSFDDLVAVADERVARLVANVTPDCRAPLPDRRKWLANQVGHGDAAVQILALVDTRHECVMHCEALRRNSTPAVAASAQDAAASWLETAKLVVASLHKLHASPLTKRCNALKTELAKLNTLIIPAARRRLA